MMVDKALYATSAAMAIVAIISAAYFGFIVGKERGVEDVYLDCRDRGFTVFHGVKYPCGAPSNKG